MYNKDILYDTFNAKYLTYQEVASSFIINEEFAQLVTNNHTLLMGPRGCGKTTLLKMLTPSALNYWEGEKANEIKNKIPFTGVYIPTDIQWKSQMNYLNNHLIDQADFNEKVTDFLITTNVQVALCRTFNSLIQIKISLEQEKILIEEKVCNELIYVWDIEKPLSASFDDLEIALEKRVQQVNSLISKIIYKKETQYLSNSLPDFVFSDFLKIISNGCKVFEKNTGLSEAHRWALCFDELEIAPEFFQTRLYSFLRSTNQKFIYKLTTTPLVKVKKSIVEASQDNDFKPVRLWVYDEQGQNKWESFCDKLVSAKLSRFLNMYAVSPSKILKKYSLNDIIRNELQIKSNIKEVNLETELFKSLAKKDSSFRKFLIARGLNPENPVPKNIIENKSIFLKHKVRVLYRHLYKYTTRKVPPIHYGVPFIYELCDGNPRAVIGLIDEMLQFLTEIKPNEKIVAVNKQSEIINIASKKYFNLIKNHPIASIEIRKKPFNLADDIIKKIGNYIYSRIVKEDFDPSAPTTFIVDQEIDYKIVLLLEHALHIGAIVYLDPIESLSTNGIVGKRFRLSYLFTPLYRIPNRVEGKINLSTILEIDNSSLSDSTQASIFS